eukprot:TRINITY_DN1320_c0_g1_i14.p1 TRINITY_DN1320_c0_g1~~TRINITY_DN1320_c0_g1_i14.p1  ORF type:complete len:362 (-),score=75.39 TRINITY_DN1320_c0_g1_i14:158-1243(-)
MEKDTGMIYRFLGRTGIKVSVIGYGNMTFNKDTPEMVDNCFKCITKAYEKGVNYFDTAELYGFGNAELVLGKCLKKAGWPRKDYVLSTKVFRIGSKPNDEMLSRKHIIEGVTASLKRLQLDYADIVFAHRYDYETPIEETCRAFNWLIEHGKAFYWGTSEWSAEQIMEAFDCCNRLGLAKPVVDQSEYSVLMRKRFEGEMAPIFEKYGYGTTTWSPLAGGYLTGKYNNKETPGGTRYAGALWDKEMIEKIKKIYIGEDENKFYKRLQGLAEIAKEFKCTQAQLALAWSLVNKDVSTAIIGSTKPEQLDDSLAAIEVAKRWTPEVEKKIEDLMQNTPDPEVNFRVWKSFPSRRSVALEYHKA